MCMHGCKLEWVYPPGAQILESPCVHAKTFAASQPTAAGTLGQDPECHQSGPEWGMWVVPTTI